MYFVCFLFQNEANVSNTNKTNEICFVNEAFDKSGDEESVEKLNNVQQNIGKEKDVGIQDVITNDLYKYRNDSLQNKKENNKENVDGNLKKDNTITFEMKSASGVVRRQIDVCTNRHDKNSSVSSDINLKRSLSFGDKPSQRKLVNLFTTHCHFKSVILSNIMITLLTFKATIPHTVV